MNLTSYLRIIVFSILALVGLGATQAAMVDTLYIGDGGDNTVKKFKADTGEFLGQFVKSTSPNLTGPRGLVFDSQHNLLLANQNASTSKSGDIFKYDGSSGAFLGAIVSHDSKVAPYAPRGMVLSNGTLFVASIVSDQHNNPGSVLAYSGAGVATLTPPSSFQHPFHPRGVVIGPDSFLYVSNVPNLPAPDGTGLGGQVLRFNPQTYKFIDVIIGDSGGVHHLNRPEGLVFGPDGHLYITSFRAPPPSGAPPSDTDSIRIYSVAGEFRDKIDLYKVGVEPRVFAQALLFGPGGGLFVPITGGAPLPDGTPPPVGQVRRYSVVNKKFAVFVPAFGPLQSGFYLTFGNTDPATLQYH